MHYFSNRAQIALVALVFFFGPIHGNNWEPCGDWIAYNDEKCFKIIDDTLRTFDEAKDVCATQEHTSTLAVIRSSEEQQFLSDYLFKTEQKVENFWIGAKYSSQNGSFIWIDNTPLNYTNWDAGHTPRNLENHCVQMQADMAVVGKWKDWRCIKKNAVVCQRMQFWSTEFLQKKFLNSRRQQMDSLDTIRNLTHSLAIANEKISSQKESLQNAYQRIDTHKQNLEHVNQRIDELKQNFENAISNSNTRFNEQKQNFENAISNANARINEQKQNLKSSISNANAKINEQKQNFIPIGFLYTQLHMEKAPADIWPWMTWTDVSSEYAGVFFRVEGGGSGQFGQVQTENTQRLVTIQQTGAISECTHRHDNVSTVIGGWSQFVYSGSDSGNNHCLKFEMSNSEIRPKNVAIRVWRRVA